MRAAGSRASYDAGQSDAASFLRTVIIAQYVRGAATCSVPRWSSAFTSRRPVSAFVSSSRSKPSSRAQSER